MTRQTDPAVRSRSQSLIELQPRCGMTVTEFCDAHNISTASFYPWRSRLAEEPLAGPAFLPVRVAEGTGPTSQVIPPPHVMRQRHQKIARAEDAGPRRGLDSSARTPGRTIPLAGKFCTLNKMGCMVRFESRRESGCATRRGRTGCCAWCLHKTR
jgi:hypothetical protein